LIRKLGGTAGAQSGGKRGKLKAFNVRSKEGGTKRRAAAFRKRKDARRGPGRPGFICSQDEGVTRPTFQAASEAICTRLAPTQPNTRKGKICNATEARGGPHNSSMGRTGTHVVLRTSQKSQQKTKGTKKKKKKKKTTKHHNVDTRHWPPTRSY